MSKRIVNLGFIWFAAFVCLAPAWAAMEEVKIGVLAKRGPEQCLSMWSPTADYLSSKIPGKTFRIVPLNFDQVYSVVKKGEVDFILANPSFYVELEIWYDANRIATLKNQVLGRVYKKFAGVVFARADRHDIRGFADLKGKTLMGVEETSLGGWQMAWREMLSWDIDPYSDCQAVLFGGTHDAVVYAVQNGTADAGTVRSDTLERMEAEGKIQLQDFYIFQHSGGPDEEVPFAHSTRSYPEWPMAKVKHTSDDLAERVADALLETPPDSPAATAAQCAGWTIPLNYQPVLDCFRDLKIGPYKDLGKFTFTEVLFAYKYWILSGLAAFLGILGTTILVGRLNGKLRQSFRRLENEVTEREQAQSALSESQKRFQAVMNSLDAFVYVADMTTHELLYVNKYGEDIFGEITGKQCWKVLQENLSGPCNFCTNDKLIDLNGKATGVYVWEFQNTVTKRWYQCRDQAIRWMDGRLVRLEIATDITERKEAEEQLRSKNAFLNNVLESLTHPFCVIDPNDYRIKIANKAVTGGRFRPGSTCHALTHLSDKPCDGKTHPCPIQIIKKTRQPVILEHVHYDSEGNPRNVEVHGYPIFDEEGRLSEIIEYSLDVTERKKAEEAVKEKEKYLRTVMASIQAGVIVSDSVTHQIIDVNPSATAMIGVAGTKILGARREEYLELNGNGGNRSADDKIKKAGEDGVLKSANGTVEVRLSQANTDIKGRSYTVQSFVDISDMRQLLKEQAVNIDMAKKLLDLINTDSIQQTKISDDLNLFIYPFAISSKAAGGDHYLVRTLPSVEGGSGARRTIVSIKDQSGHEVNCILRSIITDLLHNSLLYGQKNLSLEASISKLNQELNRSGLFAEDDFLTAMNIEINHETLKLKYVSCGHPPFLLIRESEVIVLPGVDGAGQNLPIGTIGDIAYSAGTVQLEKGDKIIFYTDGLLELYGSERPGPFSTQELQEMVGELVLEEPGCRVTELVTKLLQAAAGFRLGATGETLKEAIPDDVTVIGLELEGFERPNEVIVTPKNLDLFMEQVEKVEEAICRDWLDKGFDNSGNRLQIVLEEAMLNAWIHGHGRNPDRPITIRWWEANVFHLEVIDRGPGFDIERIPDPTLFHNTLKESGRGLAMIRLFSDTVTWEKGGGHLSVSFRKNRFCFNEDIIKQTYSVMPLWQQNA